jgi:hypothetical protein
VLLPFEIRPKGAGNQASAARLFQNDEIVEVRLRRSVSPWDIHVDDFGLRKIHVSEIDAVDIAFVERRAGKVCAVQSRVAKVASDELRAGEVDAAQIGVREVVTIDTHAGQVEPSKFGVTEIAALAAVEEIPKL